MCDCVIGKDGVMFLFMCAHVYCVLYMMWLFAATQ